jgi:hypothetical protein
MEWNKGYLAVDEDGYETAFRILPVRSEEVIDDDYGDTYTSGIWEEQSPAWIPLPKGTIEKIIGHKLTWKDEPFPLIEIL